MRVRFMPLVLGCAACCAIDVGAQRPADRHPDLQGFWTNGTATPLQRPAEFKDTPFLTGAEAEALEKSGLERFIKSLPAEDQLGANMTDLSAETSTLKLHDGGRMSLV